MPETSEIIFVCQACMPYLDIVSQGVDVPRPLQLSHRAPEGPYSRKNELVHLSLPQIGGTLDVPDRIPEVFDGISNTSDVSRAVVQEPNLVCGRCAAHGGPPSAMTPPCLRPPPAARAPKPQRGLHDGRLWLRGPKLLFG